MPKDHHCLERILQAVQDGAESWKDVHEKTGIKLTTIHVIACVNKIRRPTLRSRYEMLLNRGYTVNQIASAEGESYITIYQRIKRNGLLGLYHKIRFPSPGTRCRYGTMAELEPALTCERREYPQPVHTHRHRSDMNETRSPPLLICIS